MRRLRKSGFTMIELLLAVSLMAVIVGVGFYTFATANRVWRLGTEAADAIDHADLVMEQLCMALRSAYYPDGSRPSPDYGMQLVNDGDGADAHDTLSWVKLGTALVGPDSMVANSPHRVMVSAVRPDDSPDGEDGLVLKAWRLAAQPEDFDPEDEEYVKPLYIASGVQGLDFQILDPDGNLAAGKEPVAGDEQELKWIDEDWKDDYTNRLPYAVSATLYLTPAEEGGEPIAVRRLVTIPVAPLSWRDKGAAGGPGDGRGRGRDNRGGGRGPGGAQGGRGQGGAQGGGRRAP